MSGTRVLVMGASGFVGSAVTRQLVRRGDDVRVLLRRSSSTRGIDDLDVERHYGDIFDEEAVRTAMADRDVVYYCVVDTRAWLRDPAPLFATNVEGLRAVLDVAVRADLRRFVFTSTIGTIALSDDGQPVTEDKPHNWGGKGGGYIESRRAAEDLVFDYHRRHGLPAVALCVANTYGEQDWQPTPHGGMLAMAALGRLPTYFRGMSMMVVGIEDAAAAHLLAADRGADGQRYIIAESYLSTKEIHEIAAREAGVRPPRFGIPVPALVVLGRLSSIAARLLRRDLPLEANTVQLLRASAPLDHGKATRELGWTPAPTEESIRAAARFFLRQHQDRLSRKRTDK